MYLVEKESAHFITATFSDVILGEDTTIAWNKVGGEVESDVTVSRILRIEDTKDTHDTQSTLLSHRYHCSFKLLQKRYETLK